MSISLSTIKPWTTVQKILLGLNIIGLLAITYLLLTQEQDWEKLTPKPHPPTVTEKSNIDQPNPSLVMDYKNHNKAATDYAYDIKKIRQYITGEVPYNGKNLVFLTIDDGATEEVTPLVLDILKKEGVHATFFPIGSNVTEQHADLYRREIREGHAIGLHSFTHNIDYLYPNGIPDDDEIIWEAQQAIKAQKRIFGLKFQTHVWRYPGGAMSFYGLSSSKARLANELGLEWIDWNAYIGDAEPLSRRPQTLEDMLDFHAMTYDASPVNVKVVLMHDAKDKQLTLEALPHIIQFYKERGYTFGVLE